MSEPIITHSRIDRHLVRNRLVSQLKNVDTVRAKALADLGIHTVGDLLWHVPFRYLDMTTVVPISSIFDGEATVVGHVAEVLVKKPRPKLTVTEVVINDGSGALVGVWFNQPWIQRTFEVGQRCAFTGSVKFEFGMRRMANPYVEQLSEANAHKAAMVPVYRTTEKLAQGWLRKIVGEAVAQSSWGLDEIPLNVRNELQLPSLSWAFLRVHKPQSLVDTQVARRRLAFEELFWLQLVFAYKRSLRLREAQGISHVTTGPVLELGREAFGFHPSEEQSNAIAQILEDMAAPYSMQRMVLGDVGTGKTMVAAHALFAVADTGTQAAMMAPTEVLAQQYARKVGPVLDRCGVSWAVLTGSTPQAEKQSIKGRLAEGAITVLFGTHAVIQEDVEFKSLSLVIIDEQHRFGVQQRKQLRSKAADPDVLVMSATPIPRSLTLIAYGDLDVSTLRHRPIEGAGVTTKVLKPSQSYKAHEAVHQAVKQGRQAYVICALVEDSDALAVQSATTQAEMLSAGEYAQLRVGLLTGRMSPKEKQSVMGQFVAGDIDVLVATTVIEVGVDVPNATQMIVLDAERFGLAQLHQLRGRVGRGAYGGQVWLISDTPNPDTQKRLAALESTSDGFAVAQLDLELRGAGDVMGTRQHGSAALRVADLALDSDLLSQAYDSAQALIAEDPTLSKGAYALAKHRLQDLLRSYDEWVKAG